MNKNMPVSVQEAIGKLLHYGLQECTQAASRQNGVEYLWAFEHPDDEQRVCYACVTEEDLFALLALVEASASQGRGNDEQTNKKEK